MSEQSTGAVIEKTSYTHDKLIDVLIANPRVTQRQLAAHFGYTEGWMSQIVRSDSFREMYESRRKELVDPTILQSLESRFSALTHRALDVILGDLDARQNPEVALKALDMGSRALGYGAHSGSQVNIQTNFVVAMPEKSEDSDKWIASHAPPRTLEPDGAGHG